MSIRLDFHHRHRSQELSGSFALHLSTVGQRDNGRFDDTRDPFRYISRLQGLYDLYREEKVLCGEKSAVVLIEIMPIAVDVRS